MRILVLSDSHSLQDRVKKALKSVEGYSMIIHLGDGERDLTFLSQEKNDIDVLQVKGNCDFRSSLPAELLFEVEGKKIFCTHGYLQKVKFTSRLLVKEAEKNGADITLYGHTHRPVTEYENGRYFFNPGSLLNGDFGYIDIVDGGVNCVQLNLRDLKQNNI